MDLVKKSKFKHDFAPDYELGGEQLRKFVFAGNSVFTILNQATKNRFTIKVKKHKENEVWFVSVLTGSDNINSYTFIGTYFPTTYSKGGEYKKSFKSKITNDAVSSKTVSWFFKKFFNNQSKYPTVKVYHEGRCGRCSRRLTTPESIKASFGPECIKLMNKV